MPTEDKLSAPQRKAVTGISQLPRPDEVVLPNFILAQIDGKVEEYREKLIRIATDQLTHFQLDIEEPTGKPGGKRRGAAPGTAKTPKPCPVPGCKNPPNTRFRYGYFCEDHMDSKEYKAYVKARDEKKAAKKK